MSYISDWLYFEREQQAAIDAHPEFANCDKTKNCPSESHWFECGKKRRELYSELYAKIDGEL